MTHYRISPGAAPPPYTQGEQRDNTQVDRDGFEQELFEIYFYNFIYLFTCFWLPWVFIAVRAFSSCRELGLLLVAACGLLVAVASLPVEHGLTQAQQLAAPRHVG